MLWYILAVSDESGARVPFTHVENLVFFQAPAFSLSQSQSLQARGSKPESELVLSGYYISSLKRLLVSDHFNVNIYV